MLARLQKSMKEKDQGFTLIELLVVIVIIGILAAIAIPLFLNQRQKGVEASLKSDLKTLATMEETFFIDNAVYVATEAALEDTAKGNLKFTASKGNTFKAKVTATGFCISAANTGAAKLWYYDSEAGGVMSDITKATGACAAAAPTTDF